MFSTATLLRNMAGKQVMESNLGTGGSTIELARTASPSLAHRRHRRSYTISSPMETRVSVFPNSLLPLSVRKPTPGPGLEDKENEAPSKQASVISLPREENEAAAEAEPAKTGYVPIRPRIFHTTSIHNDRFLDLPALPSGWQLYHDRAICILDSRDYDHDDIVVKMRRCFPELKGVLTPLMIDKRLRILDQNIEVDYWRSGVYAQATPKPLQEISDNAEIPKKRKRSKDPKPGPSLFRGIGSGGSSPGSSSKMVTRSFGTGFRSYFGRS